MGSASPWVALWPLHGPAECWICVRSGAGSVFSIRKKVKKSFPPCMSVLSTGEAGTDTLVRPTPGKIWKLGGAAWDQLGASGTLHAPSHGTSIESIVLKMT